MLKAAVYVCVVMGAVTLTDAPAGALDQPVKAYCVPGADWGEGVASDPTGFVYADQQHVFARDVRGQLAHWWWALNDGTLRGDVWGSGLVGHPASFVYGDQQHVFAQGTDGELHHWYFDPGTNRVHTETWE